MKTGKKKLKNFERARTEESKEFRIKQILDASEKIYDSTPFEKITYLMIAEKSNFTRSNLYKYFKNKEDIFLSLLLNEIRKWVRSAESLLSEPNAFQPQNFPKLMTLNFLNHQRLLKLRSILFTHLELYASVDTFLTFKTESKKELDRLISKIETNLPGSKKERISEFFLLSVSLAAGIFPLYCNQKKTCQILEDHGLPYDTINLTEVLTNGIRALSNEYIFKEPTLRLKNSK